MPPENESAGEFNLHEAAEEIIGSSSDSQSDSTDESSQAEGQSSDSQQTVENKELSAEDILKQVSEEKETPEQFADLLKQVNGLGAIHHGAPITVDTPEKLKQLLEMGAGFYQKTETHANEVKAREAEFAQKETVFHEREQQIAQKEQQLEQHSTFNSVMMDLIQELQANDPELFAHIDGLFSQKERAFLSQKPLEKKFEGKISELEKKLQGVQDQKKGEELQGIKQSWEKELGELQTQYAPNLAKLGVKTDWEKVKAHWTADASGKTSVKQALFAVHGEEIEKAYESRNKLLETKAKNSAKLLGRTGVGNGQRGGTETIEAPTMGDYGSILRQASATL